MVVHQRHRQRSRVRWYLSLVLMMSGVSVVGTNASRPSLDFRATKPEAPTPIVTRSGVPIFVRELYTLKRDEDFRIAEFHGFNAAIGPGATVLAPGERFGFHITEANWFTKANYSNAVREARLGREYDGLFAYNLADEPDLRMDVAPPEALAKAATLLRAEDPQAQLSVTLAGPSQTLSEWGNYARIVDIVRVDPYPLISGKPWSHVHDRVERARIAGPNKPVITILQAWSFPDGPWPTDNEIRQMVWQSLVAGSAGISYFDWNYAAWSTRPDFWHAVIQCNAMIANDLEPLLITGTRRGPIQTGDVYATHWHHPEHGWRILATRLGNSNDTVSIRIHLPASITDQSYYVIRGSELVDNLADPQFNGRRARLTGALMEVMPPMSQILISDRPINIRSNDVLWGSKQRGAYRLELPPGTELWQTDIAGRPLIRTYHSRSRSTPNSKHLALSAGTPYRIHAPDSERQTPSIHIPTNADDDFTRNGPVFSIYPGGRFHHDITVRNGQQTQHCFPQQWHDNHGNIDADALAQYVKIDQRRTPLDWLIKRQRFRFRPTIPTAVSPDGVRDHLFTFSYGSTPDDSSITRVIRYRIEAPFDLDWRWHDDNSGWGTLYIHHRFSPRHLPCRERDLVVQGGGDGIDAEIYAGAKINDTRMYMVHLSPRARNECGMTSLTVTVSADDHRLAHAQLATLRYDDGRVIAPPAERKAIINTIAPLDLNNDFDTIWSARPDSGGLRHFLRLGEREFSSDDHEAWLASDMNHLYWFMRSTSPEPLRADTPRDDVPFIGDDAMNLFLASSEPTRFYRFQVNPRAVCRRSKIDSGAVSRLDAATVIRTDIDGQTWRMVARIPWPSIGGYPNNGETIQVNVGAARSVAPRVMSTWQQMTIPFDPATALAPAQILPAFR